MQKEKQYYEKMVDFRQYGAVLLAVGVFFYLGVIIPSAAKTQTGMTNMMIGSMICLVLSIISLTFSKFYRKKLLETEEGQEFLNNK